MRVGHSSPRRVLTTSAANASISKSCMPITSGNRVDALVLADSRACKLSAIFRPKSLSLIGLLRSATGVSCRKIRLMSARISVVSSRISDAIVRNPSGSGSIFATHQKILHATAPTVVATASSTPYVSGLVQSIFSDFRPVRSSRSTHNILRLATAAAGRRSRTSERPRVESDTLEIPPKAPAPLDAAAAAAQKRGQQQGRGPSK